MPVAAMNENNRPPSWKNHVWFSWKGPVVKSVSKTSEEQSLSNGQFDPGIASTDAGHDPASGCRIHNISHSIWIPKQRRLLLALSIP